MILKAISHFKTITHHKILVMKGCFAIGLYRQGLMHDMSKYSPTEFFVGAKYYQGTRSPNNAEREDIGYSSAWLHHKGRNRHHYEYWLDYVLPPKKGIGGMKMPEKYVFEMFIDRVSASKTYQGEDYNQTHPLAYYKNGIAYQLMHPETAALLEKLLTMLAEKGEEETYRYIRWRIKVKRYRRVREFLAHPLRSTILRTHDPVYKRKASEDVQA